MTSTNDHIALRVTPLSKLKRTGPLLQGPMRKLENVQFSSWIEDALPEVLWCTLIITELPREDGLACFRRILRKVTEHKDVLGNRRLEHSRLAELDAASFDLFFADECKTATVPAALAPLLLLEDLPDRPHWLRLLPAPRSDGWDKLADAIAGTFDHQSQAATDCRWFKVTTVAALGNIVLPREMEERRKELNEYPDRGDMSFVRPSIRALEMTFRPGSAGEVRTEWLNDFWQEGWRKTECFLLNPDDGAKIVQHEQLFKQLVELSEALTRHFVETMEHTGVDAKHDSSFGLVFYITHLLFFSLKGIVGQTIPGRIILRTAVECYITLAYLAHHDNPTVWMQYRHYGAGQIKLAFLKRINEDDVPSFISTELLEQMANHDTWLEFQDIKLGAWADRNLRDMAKDAGEKAFYDRYYDLLSGYVHGNWSAALHSVFGQCLNPLHRFHRIPMPPRILIDDAVPDLKKICNLALDKLAQMYPPFKPRLREARPEAAAEEVVK
ncbi:DUF5677 domain-containing protein [Bradyrhizobium sp. DASA03076]|uniref:DUF5677 domain-containing protein n=1 Tax=Bradyrhizobium sp. BLXBL-03 TaxID=3395916 RepID=UPI003F716DA5